MEHMKTAEKQRTFSDVIKSEPLVLVDFFTEWCGPCKMMKPILQELKNLVGENVTIAKIDVDKNPLVANVYQIMGVPTLALFKNGKIVWRRAGVMPAKQLEQIINEHLN